MTEIKAIRKIGALSTEFKFGAYDPKDGCLRGAPPAHTVRFQRVAITTYEAGKFVAVTIKRADGLPANIPEVPSLQSDTIRTQLFQQLSTAALCNLLMYFIRDDPSTADLTPKTAQSYDVSSIRLIAVPFRVRASGRVYLEVISDFADGEEGKFTGAFLASLPLRDISRSGGDGSGGGAAEWMQAKGLAGTGSVGTAFTVAYLGSSSMMMNMYLRTRDSTQTDATGVAQTGVFVSEAVTGVYQFDRHLTQEQKPQVSADKREVACKYKGLNVEIVKAWMPYVKNSRGTILLAEVAAGSSESKYAAPEAPVEHKAVVAPPAIQPDDRQIKFLDRLSNSAGLDGTYVHIFDKHKANLRLCAELVVGNTPSRVTETSRRMHGWLAMVTEHRFQAIARFISETKSFADAAAAILCAIEEKVQASHSTGEDVASVSEQILSAVAVLGLRDHVKLGAPVNRLKTRTVSNYGNQQQASSNTDVVPMDTLESASEAPAGEAATATAARAPVSSPMRGPSAVAPFRVPSSPSPVRLTPVPGAVASAAAAGGSVLSTPDRARAMSKQPVTPFGPNGNPEAMMTAASPAPSGPASASSRSLMDALPMSKKRKFVADSSAVYAPVAPSAAAAAAAPDTASTGPQPMAVDSTPIAAAAAAPVADAPVDVKAPAVSCTPEAAAAVAVVASNAESLAQMRAMVAEAKAYSDRARADVEASARLKDEVAVAIAAADKAAAEEREAHSALTKAAIQQCRQMIEEAKARDSNTLGALGESMAKIRSDVKSHVDDYARRTIDELKSELAAVRAELSASKASALKLSASLAEFAK